MMLGSFTSYIILNVNFQPNQVYGQSYALNVMCVSFLVLLAAYNTFNYRYLSCSLFVYF